MENPKTTPGYIFYDKDEKINVPVMIDDSGNLCPYYFLKEGVFKQAAAYGSMYVDLYDCIKAIEYLITIYQNPEVPKIVKTSLLFSSIVRYARCFTEADGRGITLNEKDVFKGTKSELKDFHQKTYELRNQYLAHAGVSDHETIALVAILNPDLRNKKLEAIKGTIFRLMDDDSNINKYLDLYAHVAQHAFFKVKDLNPIIMRKAKELSIDTMYSELKVPQRESLIPMDIITDLK